MGRGRSFTSPAAVANAVEVLDVVLVTAVADLLVFAASICCADTVCWKERISQAFASKRVYERKQCLECSLLKV